MGGNATKEVQDQAFKEFQGHVSKEVQGQISKEVQGHVFTEVQGQVSKDVQGQEFKEVVDQAFKEVQGQAFKEVQCRETLQSAENYWLQCIKTWYPELHTRTYFLPPLHFNRVPYSVENIAGQQVLVAQIPQNGPDQTTSTIKSRSRERKSQPMDLYQCLGVRSIDDALKMCLLSDQLSGKRTASDINHIVLKDLGVWWQQLVKMSGAQPSITETVYEHLVARFCGPATTVEVHCVTAPRLAIRTIGEAVSATGETMARLVLFPQQVELLNRSPPWVFLIGPPGTGKTIVLIVQGLTWLMLGHNVHVVSTWSGSRAAKIAIEHQLKKTAKTTTARSRVHRHQFYFQNYGEVETAVRRLKSLSEGRQLCVIADEVVHDSYRKPFTEFCGQLIVQVPGVYLWGASVHHEARPLCLEEVKLTTSLRSPPVVVREVMEAKEIKIYNQVLDYTVSDVPVPTDGPAVIRFTHRDGQSGHTEYRPRDCVECGHQVARVLTELNVGRTGNSNGPPPLQYRDVLVLCNDYLIDDRVDSNGQVTTTASGLVQGLRACHVPVRVVEVGDEAAIRDTALGVGDVVTVTNWRDVHGLERKVVVVEIVYWSERLDAMSRCTSQLVLIDWRPV